MTSAIDNGWEQSAEAWIKRIDEGESNRELLLDAVMCRLAGEVVGLRVLDAGCGEGRFCRMLGDAMIEALGRNFLSHLEREVFPGGCFFAYTSAELGPRPGPIHRKVADITGQWTVLFVELLEAAQAAGAIKAGEDVRQLAFELDSYLILGNFGFVMEKTQEPLERAGRAFQDRLTCAKTQP